MVDKYESIQELLAVLKDCAERAGIYEHMFVSFGSLLGAIRPTARKYVEQNRIIYCRGMIEFDGDGDMGILSDRCDPARIEQYFAYCQDAGVMAVWPRPEQRIRRRPDNGEILWFSAKKRSGGVKICNWFFHEWKGYMLHGKGKGWTGDKKFSIQKWPRQKDVEGIALGAPAKYFKELVPMEFEGVKLNVPKLSGSLLDYWYPLWARPKKGGASRKKIVVIIKKFNNPKTWQVI